MKKFPSGYVRLISSLVDLFLSVKYSTELLAEDPIAAHQKTEVLAKLCGIASRANFLKLFSEIYGVSPQEYQHQCRERSLLQMADFN